MRGNFRRMDLFFGSPGRWTTVHSLNAVGQERMKCGSYLGRLILSGLSETYGDDSPAMLYIITSITPLMYFSRSTALSKSCLERSPKNPGLTSRRIAPKIIA